MYISNNSLYTILSYKNSFFETFKWKLQWVKYRLFYSYRICNSHFEIRLGLSPNFAFLLMKLYGIAIDLQIAKLPSVWNYCLWNHCSFMKGSLLSFKHLALHLTLLVMAAAMTATVEQEPSTSIFYNWSKGDFYMGKTQLPEPGQQAYSAKTVTEFIGFTIQYFILKMVQQSNMTPQSVRKQC